MTRPVLLYDGDCAFCTSCARLLERIGPDAEIVAWQLTDLAELGVTEERATEAVQWVEVDGTIRSGHEAIAAILGTAGWIWRTIGRMILLPGISWLAARAYRLVADNRYRLPIPGRSLDMSILGIDHFQLAAPPGCEDEARRFFGAVLGLSEIEKPPSLAARGGVWFGAGAQQVHVGVEEAFVPASKAHPALLVETSQLDEVAERLARAGAPVAWDDELAPQRRFYTADPWGNRIELIAGR